MNVQTINELLLDWSDNAGCEEDQGEEYEKEKETKEKNEETKEYDQRKGKKIDCEK